jgi:hypothetical protein
MGKMILEYARLVAARAGKGSATHVATGCPVTRRIAPKANCLLWISPIVSIKSQKPIRFCACCGVLECGQAVVHEPDSGISNRVPHKPECHPSTSN